MKFKIRSAALCGLAALSLLSGTAAVKSIDREEGKNDTLIADSTPVQSAAQYYLRECEGYIAVFSDLSSDTPLSVTDIETVTLTDADRDLLKNGIAAENKTELIKLLEDFNS